MATAKQKALLAGGLGLMLYWMTRPKGTVTTWAGFDLSSLGGLVDYPDRLKAFARAIARAEGFYVQGSVPQRANNPGAIKIPGWTGQTLGEGISVLESEDAGWAALHKQLMLIVSGQSSIYNLDMTIAEMSERWTGTQTEAKNWSANVARVLDVDPSTPLWQAMV